MNNIQLFCLSDDRMKQLGNISFDHFLEFGSTDKYAHNRNVSISQSGVYSFGRFMLLIVDHVLFFVPFLCYISKILVVYQCTENSGE